METSLSLAPVSNLNAPALSAADAAGATLEPAPFAGLVRDAIGQVDQLEDVAHRTVAGLMTGTGVDVHRAVIAAQKASMAFELALSIRNKAVQAYQQVMGMQF